MFPFLNLAFLCCNVVSFLLLFLVDITKRVFSQSFVEQATAGIEDPEAALEAEVEAKLRSVLPDEQPEVSALFDAAAFRDYVEARREWKPAGKEGEEEGEEDGETAAAEPEGQTADGETGEEEVEGSAVLKPSPSVEEKLNGDRPNVALGQILHHLEDLTRDPPIDRKRPEDVPKVRADLVLLSFTNLVYISCFFFFSLSIMNEMPSVSSLFCLFYPFCF